MSVLELVRKYEIEPQRDLIVIYDELDLPLGMIRVRARGSSAGHNGMQSIINALQTEEIGGSGSAWRRMIRERAGEIYTRAFYGKSQMVGSG